MSTDDDLKNAYRQMREIESGKAPSFHVLLNRTSLPQRAIIRHRQPVILAFASVLVAITIALQIPLYSKDTSANALEFTARSDLLLYDEATSEYVSTDILLQSPSAARQVTDYSGTLQFTASDRLLLSHKDVLLPQSD